MNKEEIYDIIGIGVGPFNLSLACLSENITDLKTIFFDKKVEFDWHSGIMPEWATLQIPFIADLVSFADPKNKYSFLNYLKQQNNLYQFFIRESFFILRAEYNHYCKWAAKQLANVHFGHHVENIVYDAKKSLYSVTVTSITSNAQVTINARNLVLGTGTTPIIPEFCKNISDAVHSSANYIKHKQDYSTKKSITIVGGGQSGAEIYYDLLSQIDTHHYQLNWVTKSPHFFAMDLGKLTLEYTSPDYTQHFFSLDQARREQVINSQNALYKGIEIGLINRIYDLLYQKNKTANISTRLLPNCALQAVEEKDGQLDLYFNNKDVNKDFKLQSEVLILALGYEYKIPELLSGIKHVVNWDEKGRIKVNQNYSINTAETIFVQNVGLYSHGFTVPDLGMGCYRNSIILNKIIGKEFYPVEKQIAFQQFQPLAKEVV